jgi:hypothetical protein
MLHALTTAFFMFAATFAVVAIIGTARKSWSKIVQVLADARALELEDME